MSSQEIRPQEESGHGHRHRNRHRARTRAGGDGPAIRAQESDRGDIGERIAVRAYQLYLERGGEEGYALEDWLRAEKEIAHS